MKEIRVNCTRKETTSTKIILTDEEYKDLMENKGEGGVWKKIEDAVAISFFRDDTEDSFDKRYVYSGFDEDYNQIFKNTLLI